MDEITIKITDIKADEKKLAFTATVTVDGETGGIHVEASYAMLEGIVAKLKR